VPQTQLGELTALRAQTPELYLRWLTSKGRRGKRGGKKGGKGKRRGQPPNILA